MKWNNKCPNFESHMFSFSMFSFNYVFKFPQWVLLLYVQFLFIGQMKNNLELFFPPQMNTSFLSLAIVENI